MKPRKTGYRGVTFASKSEARVALLCDHLRQMWWYEPEPLRLACGYVPDFLVAHRNCEDTVNESHWDGCTPMFGLYIYVVEYKPKPPTRQYIEELCVRFGQLAELIHSQPLFGLLSYGIVNAHFAVIAGGMGYGEARHLPFVVDRLGVPVRPLGWRDSWGAAFDGCLIDETNRELSGYRFDLDHIDHRYVGARVHE